MSALNENGVTISEVNLKKPSLDDVFIHYTGRDLRETGAEKFRIARANIGGR